MFANEDELKVYIMENYPDVTDARMDDNHWDLLCDKCQMTRGFQVTRVQIGVREAAYGGLTEEWLSPQTFLFRCPVCHAFKQWIVYHFQLQHEDRKWITHYFRVTSVPSEGLDEIEELPDDPPALRNAYREAVRAMDANANTAAAAMFRRALQIITRDLLKARRGNLANELNEVVGRQYNGITLTKNFGTVGYIVKEAGNQGAHPDEDPDLLDFTAEDASDLQGIFMEIVGELFVVPAAMKRAREEFMARRKITPPTGP
jgi:hypothetical protein